MTNSSFKKGKSAAVNPYAKKFVLSNPYAKKQPAAAAVNNVTPKVKTVLPVNNNAKQVHNSLKRVAAAGTASMAAGPVASGSIAKRPQNNGAVSRKAVTPTPPKKKQIPHKHNRPGSSISKTVASTGSINNSARAVVASSYTTP